MFQQGAAVSNLNATPPRGLVWHRRDLRIDDNASLAACLDAGLEPVGVFVFDEEITAGLPREDRRIDFIHRSVGELARTYAGLGLDFRVLAGNTQTLIDQLVVEYDAKAVFAGRDYEEQAKIRDEKLGVLLAARGRELVLMKEHVVFENAEVRTGAGGDFSVFTPYKAAWLRLFSANPPTLRNLEREIKTGHRPPIEPRSIPSLEELGFASTDLDALGVQTGARGAKHAAKAFAAKLAGYARDRDFPGIEGTSRLGVHLRFGTVSCRRMALWAHAQTDEGSRTWLSELVWREFYSSILDRRPDLCRGTSYQPRYAGLQWSNEPARLAAWKSGRTGVPLVDAAMRELLATGSMHNRARMVVASYLVKHLECDWRLGEAHFAQWLLDYDLASNNGGWQWSASTGADAQPYFRIFNPRSQSEKFDAAGAYVLKWVPELANSPLKAIHSPSDYEEVLQKAGIILGQHYPRPLVVHAQARALALAKYGAVA